MGIFSVVIEELEDGLNAVLKQVDVAQQAKNALQAGVSQLVGPVWEGAGARAFEQEVSSEVIDAIMDIIGFSSSFTDGIKKVLDILRTINEWLPF